PHPAMLRQVTQTIRVPLEHHGRELVVGHGSPGRGSLPPGTALELGETRGHVHQAKVDLEQAQSEIGRDLRRWPDELRSWLMLALRPASGPGPADQPIDRQGRAT